MWGYMTLDNDQKPQNDEIPNVRSLIKYFACIAAYISTQPLLIVCNLGTERNSILWIFY